MANDKYNEHNLVRLDNLHDYKVADGDPDVRGWTFVDGKEERLGIVDSLIVDPDAKKVRYLDVELDSEFSHSESERHILVPIGLARVHEDRDEVLLNEVDRDTLLACPVYRGPGVTLDYEHALVERLGQNDENSPYRGTIARNPADFYSYDYYDLDSFYGPRRNPVTENNRYK